MAEVLKKLTEAALDAGLLTLTQLEIDDLDLPAHSCDLTLRHHTDELVMQWHGAARTLGGEAFAEMLQLFGRVDGSLRLSRTGSTFDASFVEPSRQRTFSRPIPTSGPPGGWDMGTPPPPRPKRRGTKERTSKFRMPQPHEYEWTGDIGLLTESWRRLGEHVTRSEWADRSWIDLRVEGERLAALDHFETLLAVDASTVEPMPHQIGVVRKVLTAMRGRAVLADEVGLGKTIEAGLIMKELALRGLIERVLVICPASLREQWQTELLEKFDERFEIALKHKDGLDHPKLILTPKLAVHHAGEIAGQDWDLVIVDEAHKSIGGPKIQKLLQRLSRQARYILLLTATPVQNKLEELYTLVETTRPGTFTGKAEFKKAFVGPDKKTPVNAARLRELVSSVIVRTTRAQAGVDQVRRVPLSFPVTLTKSEREVYELCLDAFRGLAASAADRSRARFLAHRLTASPRALAIAATRIAEQVSDPRIHECLAQIAKQADAVGESSRMKVALRQIEEWRAARKSVLVFTQHTGTATDLLATLAGRGISARAYHGGMAAEERTKTLKAFREGRIEVMVSTDAGAEGLNLQHNCHCVLNFDLPWNPMRIEQRIGRVDRLGQPEKEVFIANLFTRDTIDEHVFRLLHDKLRMFELLFGQVTTILGDLDDDGDDLTFDQRVLLAAEQKNERDRARRFDELGKALADARDRADETFGADQSLSAWLATEATAHRAGMDPAAASELAAAMTGEEHKRQADVRAWVLRLLDASGAGITYREHGDDGEVVFLSADVPAHLVDSLDGRDQLHLAFSKPGLSLHPDAELCAAGSLVFDDLLDAVRGHRSVLVEQALPPEIDLSPPHRAAPGFTFVARVAVCDEGFTSVATFKAIPEDSGTAEEIVSVSIDRAPTATSVSDTRFLPLQPGQPLPSSIGTPSHVAGTVRRQLNKQLTTWLNKRKHELNQQRKELLRRRTAFWKDTLAATDREIASIAWDSDKRERMTNLRDQQVAARDTELANLAKSPTPTVRAEALTLTLCSAETFTIEEEWLDPHGEAWAVQYPCGDDGLSARLESESGRRIVDELVICADGHTVDLTEAARCTTCDRYRCVCCPTGATLEPCPLCTAPSCGVCRRGPLGVCPKCAVTKRATDLDMNGWHAFRTASDVELVVGTRAAIVRAPGQPESLVVPKSDRSDPLAAYMRRVAQDRGLPYDAGFRILRSASMEAAPEGSGLLVRSVLGTRVEYVVDPVGGTDLLDDPRTVDTDVSDVVVSGEDELAVAKLLKRLRAQDPAPLPPALERREIRTTTVIVLDEAGLAERSFELPPVGPWQQIAERRSGWQLIDDHARGRVAAAEMAGVSARARLLNTSFLITIDGDLPKPVNLFAPAEAGRTLNSELAAVAAAEREAQPLPLGLAPGAVCDPPAPPPVTTSRLVSHHIRPIFAIRPAAGELQVLPAAVPEAAGWTAASGGRISNAPESVGRALAELFDTEQLRIPRAEVVPVWESEEIWQGHGIAERTFALTSTSAGTRVLDDSDEPAEDFGVCSHGHLHMRQASWSCPACATWSCGACGDAGQLAPCQDCGEEACGRCRAQAPAEVSDASCAMCDRRSCEQCRRSLVLDTCVVCRRSGCDCCISEGVCGTCRGLVPTPLAGLPDLGVDLHLHDEVTYLAADRTAVIIAVVGVARRELVVAHPQGVLQRFCAPDRTPADLLARRTGAAADRSLDTSLDIAEETVSFAVPSEALLVLREQESCTAVLGAPARTERITTGVRSADDAIAVLLERSTPEVAEPEPATTAQWERIALLPGPVRSHSGRVPLRLSFTREAVWVGAAGIERRWSDDDAEHFRWRPGSGEMAPYGREIAHAEGAGFRVRLLRANTAAVLTVSGPDGERTVVFDDLGNDLAIQLAVERAQAAPVTIAADLPSEPPVAQPRHAALAWRQVEPILVAAATAGPGAPPSRDDLALLGLEHPPAIRPAVAGPRPRFARGVEEHFAVHTRYERAWRVQERWTGHGEAALDYVLGAGDAARTARQGDRCLSDFGVCRDGHLHEPAATWECDACETWCCPQDGDAGTLDACHRCGQESCGRCRATERPVSPARCAVCDRRSCGSCNRSLTTERCLICAREVCGRCLDAGLCTTCGSVTPASSRTTLPDELHADGLTVALAVDADATIALLRGAQRAEVAVIRNGGLQDWWTAPRSAERLALDAFGHQLAQLLQASEVTFEFETTEEAAPPGAALILSSEDARRVSWIATRDGEEVARREAVDTAVDADRVRALQASLGPARAPEPMETSRWSLVAEYLPAPPLSGPTTVVTVRDERFTNIVAVTAEGMLERRFGTARTAVWRRRTSREWVFPNAVPPGTPAVQCDIAAHNAWLTVVGSLVLLAVSSPSGGRSIWQLSGMAEELRLAELAHRLGLSTGTVRVASIIEASLLPLAVVTNGETTARQTLYRAEPAMPGDSRDATGQALTLLAPDVAVPGFQILDPEVHRALRPALEPLLPTVVHHVHVVPDIVDTVRAAGQERTVRYIAVPGAPQAHLLDEVTGLPTMSAVIDRAGHLVAEATACPYCRQLSCPQCTVQVQVCSLCEQRICGSCLERLSIRPADAALLCPACQSLTPVAAGGLRRAFSGARLTGRDTHHNVEFHRSRSGDWTRMPAGTRIEDRQLVQILDGLLSG